MTSEWTLERPSQPGAYWFRRGENKQPEIVTLRGGKVYYRSGKNEDLLSVRGEWGGPVTSVGQPAKTYSSLNMPSITTVIFTAFLTTIVTTIASNLLVTMLSLDEPNLVYTGEPGITTAEAMLESEPHLVNVTIEPTFRNWGLKRGHVEDLKVLQKDLQPYPDEVSVKYCNKTAISFLQSMKITCKILVTIDPQKHYPIDPKKSLPDTMEFTVVFYGPGGDQISVPTYFLIKPIYRSRSESERSKPPLTSPSP
jgi:hypothetical protein